MATQDDEAREEDLRNESDRLLEAIARLRRLERDKRAHEISSPEFHELARRITDQSRDLFRIASDEEATGAGFDERQGESIDDVDE